MEPREAQSHLQEIVRRLKRINAKLRDTQLVELCSNISGKVVDDLGFYADQIVDAIVDIEAVHDDR